MLVRSKLLFAALAAVAMMLTLVANASARNFSLTEKEFTILFRELRLEAAGNTITCPITLLGHFNERTVPKTNTKVGIINDTDPYRDAKPPCTGGTLTILAESLPWLVSYVSFTGRLPAITSIRASVTGAALRVLPTGSVECLTGTTTRNPAFGEFVLSSGRVTGFRVDETIRIPLSGGFLCSLGGEGRFAGTGTVTNLAENASITITLI